MERESWAAEQLHLHVEQGHEDGHPHLINFNTSPGAGETSGGKAMEGRVSDDSSDHP